MVLVSGRLYIVHGKRDEFLAASREAIVLARATTGCHEFIVAADPLEPNRVNIHEEWVSEMALEAFRGAGPGNDLVGLIESADVSQRILSEGVT
jgi:quinol monooxygenase YgiN